MLRFSFILPCYNVAPYVGRCIDSIESQDIPQTEYEVICVDDCSTDNTLEIIKQYQARYSNIRLICHTVNQTAGGARNTGIDEANGEYLWFVDPDDVILPNVLQYMSNKLDASNVEILFFNYQTQKESGCIEESQYALFDGDLNGQDYVLRYADGLLSTYSNIYSSLFKLEFIRKNGISYPKLRAGQDVLFIWKSILSCKYCAIIDKICYKYIRRSDSVTGSKGKFAARAIMSQSLMFAYEVSVLLLHFQNLDLKIQENIYNAICHALDFDSRNILYASEKEQKHFYEMLKQEKYKIDSMHIYMNRKSKNIFDYSRSYFIWKCILYGYRIVDVVRNKSSNVVYE